MKAFIISLYIQFRGDMRDKGVLMVYYLVPLVFYLVMGSILKLPGLESEMTLITSITIFAMSMSSFLGMPQTLVKARENSVLNAYRVAGIPAWSLPLSSIIISLFHIMIVVIIILVSAPYLFQAEWPQSILLHIFSMGIVAIASEALGVLLACFVKKQSSLTLVGQCLFLPTVMLSGIMFPANLLPKPMQIVGEILPAAQGMRLVSDGALQFTPLFVLLSTIFVAFAIAVILFRRISMRA
ncbi:MAG: type transporter [Herbinix sp.]|jgi:ABC-2 type transport system permease protein|nr:type transporter [Herbinix sp.]